MQQKFRHEDHNRQDKAKKPDYREDLIEASQSKASVLHMALSKIELEYGKRRMELARRIRSEKEQLIRKYQLGSFWIGNHVFQLADGFREFVGKNKVESPFNQTYKRHKAAAVHDFKIVEDAINSATWMRDVPKLLLKASSRLKCDKIIPLDFESGSDGLMLLKSNRL